MTIPRIGISLQGCPGIGDRIQFTSLPENYYLATNQKLIDVHREWIFDFNPYVEREEKPDYVVELPYVSRYKSPIKNRYYTSVAEKNACLFCSMLIAEKNVFLQIPIRLGHARLYRFENEPIRYNTTIAPYGKANGYLGENIVNHILKTRDGVAEVGLKQNPSISAHIDLRNDNIWNAVQAIASSREFIGNTGLSWIASCYPRVWNKLVLNEFSEEWLIDYVGMDCSNPETHWHDHRFTYYNKYEYDIGISISYLKI